MFELIKSEGEVKEIERPIETEPVGEKKGKRNRPTGRDEMARRRGRGGGKREGKKEDRGLREKKDCARVRKRGVRGNKEVGQGKWGGQVGKDL